MKTSTKAPLQSKTARQIIREFEAHIAEHSFIYTDHALWYCGVTGDPATRLQAHRAKFPNYKFELCFYACSREIATAIERYFHTKGLCNPPHAGGVNDKSRYVYIFKANPHW